MRSPIILFFCLKLIFLQLLYIQPATAIAEENDAQAIQVSLNLGEIIAFAEENEEISSLLKAALSEVADEVQLGSLDDAIEKANEVVGMDVRKDLHSLNFRLGSGLSLSGDFSLDVVPVDAVLHTEKQGNLQGLLLMTPGYSSEESGDGMLHQIQVDEGQTVYLKITETDSGVFTTASLDKDRLEKIGREVTKSQFSPSDLTSGELLRMVVAKDTFADIANELEGEDSPPANILRNMLSEMRELKLVISREGEGINVELVSQLGSEAKAEQQFQAINGGKAIAKMVLQSEGAPKEVQQVLDMLDSMEVEQDAKSVSIRLDVPSIAGVIELLESM